MKFVSTQSKLYQALAITEKIIGKNLTLPILTNTLITADKKRGVLKLCSTDLEMGVEVESTAKIEVDGEITAPTKLFSNFIKDLPNENIEFEERDKKITVRCANYKSTIKGESADDFPLIPNPNIEEFVIVNGQDFLLGIASVINSVSLMEIRPEISGVFINIKEDSICFAATDSFRLSERVMSLNSINKYLNKIIIPKKCCDGILRIFQNTQGDLRVQAMDNQIIIKSEAEDALAPKIRFVGRLIDGDYPDYEQIIPKSFSKIAEVPRNEFIQRVRTASLFSNKIKEITCELNTKKQQIEVCAINHEYGDYLASVPCSIKGEDEKITLNFQYLLDGMQFINSQILQLKVNESTTPALIQSAENERFRYLIMPIKT